LITTRGTNLVGVFSANFDFVGVVGFAFLVSFCGDFYEAVGDGGFNWVIPRMGEISDQVILSMWEKKKSRGKKRAH